MERVLVYANRQMEHEKQDITQKLPSHSMRYTSFLFFID